MACGASGEEVKAAFATPEEQRNGRQSKIVRVIIQKGADTALAFATPEHSRTRRQATVVLRCEQGGRWASRLFQIPSEQLDRGQMRARQNFVNAGEATALAWEKERKGEVMNMPPMLHQGLRGSH